MIALADLRADHFAPLVGQTFTLEVEEGAFPAPLLEVRTGAAGAHPGSTRAPFAILFRIPAGTPLRQGMYALVHPALGRHELFFTPVAADLLEAVFG